MFLLLKEGIEQVMLCGAELLSLLFYIFLLFTAGRGVVDWDLFA